MSHICKGTTSSKREIPRKHPTFPKDPKKKSRKSQALSPGRELHPSPHTPGASPGNLEVSLQPPSSAEVHHPQPAPPMTKAIQSKAGGGAFLIVADEAIRHQAALWVWTLLLCTQHLVLRLCPKPTVYHWQLKKKSVLGYCLCA